MTGDTLFLDLDGTLLRDDKSLSAFTQATLEAVRAQGHRLVFATARPVRAIRRLLPPALHQDTFLAGNGARAVRNGVFLWDETLEPALVADLTIRLAAVPGVVLALESLEALTVSALPWDHSQGDVFAVDPSLVARAIPANKILVQGTSERLDAAEVLVPAEISRVRTDSGTLLQIMPPGTDKGTAAKRLLTLVPGTGTNLGFGDDLNDLPLLEACSLGVVPANAVAGLKARASIVLPGTNDDDAVAAYLADRYLGADGPLSWRTVTEVTPEFVELTEALDRELLRKQGQAQKAYQGFNRLVGIHDVILAFQGARAVACGSFKDRGNRVAEVKRVYVRPERRGRGLSKALMKRLEALAQSRGFHTLLVETSRTFAAANGLYLSLGYAVVPNFPPYEAMDDSICFQKELG